MATNYEEMLETKGFLPYHFDNLPPKLIQKAKDELGETDEIRCAALEELRKCILAENKLKCPTGDELLIQFLRARKYDVSKALGLLKNCANLINSYPDVFGELDKERMDKFACSGFLNILPFRDSDGCVVLVCKIEKWDPDDCPGQVFFSTVTSLFICISSFPANQITGVRLVFDAYGYTFKQLRCFVPRYVPLVSKALRNSLPFRFKGIHVVNEMVVCRYAWSILKVFLSEKIKNRFYFHGHHMMDLHRFIPKEILPLEYGGDFANHNDDEWLKRELDKTHDTFSKLVKSCFS